MPRVEVADGATSKSDEEVKRNIGIVEDQPKKTKIIYSSMDRFLHLAGAMLLLE